MSERKTPICSKDNAGEIWEKNGVLTLRRELSGRNVWDALWLKRGCARHPADVHRVPGTHRFAEPVSKSTGNGCGGEPIERFPT